MKAIIDFLKFAFTVLIVFWIGAFIWNILIAITPLRLFFKPRLPNSFPFFVQGFFFWCMALGPILFLMSIFGDQPDRVKDDLFKIGIVFTLFMTPILMGLLKWVDNVMTEHGM